MEGEPTLAVEIGQGCEGEREIHDTRVRMQGVSSCIDERINISERITENNVVVQSLNSLPS